MMLLPTMPRLESRQAGASNNTAGPESKGSGSVNSSVIISLVVISAVLLLISATFIFLRNFRRLHPNPKFIPTPYLKRVWRSWNPRSKYGRLFGGNSYTPYNRPSSSLAHRDTSYSNIPPSTATGLSTEIAASTTSNAIDRNTSVRSIMTLPPYYPTPRPSERLIAREGERAGVDTVIEFPETAEEEESRRDEEMESLYQIRAARRREIEEREERRRQRREAREAGDWARVEQLRIQSRMRERAESAASIASAASSTTSLAAAGATGSAQLLAEHPPARTAAATPARLRADSAESDHRPLLDSAASMGGSRHSSLFRVPLIRPSHRRDRSNGSIMTAESEAPDTPRTSTHGDRSGSDAARTPSASQDSPPQGSVFGEPNIPPFEPPSYDEEAAVPGEEAPPYESPVRARGTGAPQLPVLRLLPAIEVTGSTPGNSVPVTPVDGRGDEGRTRR
ncbi:MAG: hypothetical protein FRX48_05535 [Lasallia pustulata]|uniref:Uncharacterized protein n=1 Tax=Lasallia pustulata TaxID=136370 RepID=A0A5M8PMK3_9LECA|nr:MAG: hypothetical protein FRX48_05535 [Lasallia pustulata]